MRTIGASEFKAKCLALLDEVASTREIITILKRGRPVAQIVPPIYVENAYPQSELKGSVEVVGDVISPVLPEEAWEALGTER
jgi:prevent-host-death family protein